MKPRLFIYQRSLIQLIYISSNVLPVIALLYIKTRNLLSTTTHALLSLKAVAAMLITLLVLVMVGVNALRVP